MIHEELDGGTIRYAVRIARRLDLTEWEITAMVYEAIRPAERRMTEPHAGVSVLAVARAFEALQRCGRDSEGALMHLKRRSGEQLEPAVVDAFLSVVRAENAWALGRSQSAA